jgi:MFS family permease
MTSEKIIRRYLTISGTYTLSASLIWGVNTLFLLDAGLDIFGVFVANAIFTGSMALFEIPTGVLADTRGRRVSFLFSVVIVLIGTLGYVGVAATGGSLWMFCFMSVILGLGYTFYSGAVEAWLVDALHAANFSGQLDQVFARGAMVSGAAMLVGSIGGGLLGTLDLSIPFIVRAVLLAIVFAIAFFTMKDIGFTPRTLLISQLPNEMQIIAKASIQFGWREPSVRLLMIASFIQSIFMAWGFYAWQPYFLDLLDRKDAIWIAGIIAALISLSTIVGNTIVEWFTRYCGRRTTLMLWAGGVSAVASVAVGVVSSFWLAVPLYLLVMVSMGVMMPVKQAYMHQVIPSAQRATIVSFDSLIGSGGSAGGQMGLGYLSRIHSISHGYIIGGLTTFLVIPVILSLRRLKSPADVIVGTAGRKGPCAQGIPEVASLDTHPFEKEDKNSS